MAPRSSSFNLHPASNFFWLSIEGTDGVGKTTVSRKLFSLIRKNHPDHLVVFLKEFSSSVALYGEGGGDLITMLDCVDELTVRDVDAISRENDDSSRVSLS